MLFKKNVHHTDFALCTYWLFHGIDKGKEPPVLVGYLVKVFKERKGIIYDISQNLVKERPARNMVKLMYLYVEFEIDDDEFENDFGRLRDDWTAVNKEVPLWLQKLSKQYDHLIQIKKNGPEYDDGIEHDYDWFSTEFRYDVMVTLQMLRTNNEYTDIILNDYSKYLRT